MTDGSEYREMYAEINALMGAVAQALKLSESDTIEAVERGEITFELATDENGNNYVAATHQGATARVYQGAIKRDAESAPD